MSGGVVSGRDLIIEVGPRFWSRVKVGLVSECWPWTGATLPFGHGTWDGPLGKTTAHRYAWALNHLEMPPRDKVVRHKCDNPVCCNPAHLELGTQAENVRDMIERGRATFTDSACRNGHEYTPGNLRIHSDGSRRCRTCIREAARKRRSSSERFSCPRCEHVATIYNLQRHVARVHGEQMPLDDLRKALAPQDPA